MDSGVLLRPPPLKSSPYTASGLATSLAAAIQTRFAEGSGPSLSTKSVSVITSGPSPMITLRSHSAAVGSVVRGFTSRNMIPSGHLLCRRIEIHGGHFLFPLCHVFLRETFLPMRTTATTAVTVTRSHHCFTHCRDSRGWRNNHVHGVLSGKRGAFSDRVLAHPRHETTTVVSSNP